MKKVVFLLLIMPAILSCESSDKKVNGTAATESGNTALSPTNNNQPAAFDSANATSIQWIDSTSQDLGRVKEGTVVEVTYRFKNTGNKPLVIESVQPSCGCTVPEKPEKPIPPGGEEVIRAKFSSSGRAGQNHKSITVNANTLPSSQHILQFNVEVTN
jgi:hypothetical protein